MGAIRIWSRAVCLTAVLAAFVTKPARGENCLPFEGAVAAAVASASRARDDVTELFACHFPAGLPFNAAAMLLDVHGFDLLNRIEPLFHVWREPGEEFIARRVVRTLWSRSEIRVVLHMKDKRITRFSAHRVTP